MEVILQEIISLLIGGITGIAEGIGSGLSLLVKSIFLEVSETGDPIGLSIFGGVIVIFAGRVYARNGGNVVLDLRKKTGRLNALAHANQR